MSTFKNTGRAASVRSADDSGEEFGEAQCAQKGRRTSSLDHKQSVPMAHTPQASASARAKANPKGRKNSLGIPPADVKKWLAEEPVTNAKGSAASTHQRKLSSSANIPPLSATARRASNANPRPGSRSGPLTGGYSIRTEFGSLNQTLSTTNNDVLRVSTSRGTNDQVQNIARRVLAAGGSAEDVNRMTQALQRRGSGSIGARRSSSVDIEAGNGYFDIKTNSVGIDPNPSTPLGPRGTVARSVFDSSTPGGTNSLSEELSQTPGGSKIWTCESRQRMPLNMPGRQGEFHLKANLRRSKRPNTGFTPATAEVRSLATWTDLTVS